MNICITAQSAKNFIKLFEKEFISLLSPEITAEELISSAFSNVVEKLSTVNDKQKVKEITLQHLGLGVVNLMAYIQKNPKFLNHAAVPKLTEIQKLTIDSVFTDENNFQELISMLAEITDNVDKIVPFVENIRYNAISLEFSRTTNQLSVYEPGIGYANNITDPQKVFEENAIQTILSSEDNIKFKMIKFDAIKDDNRFIKTSEINPKDYVLIAVNTNNEYLGFSGTGKIDSSGKYPIFTFKQYESDLIESKRAKIESQFQYESQINPSVKYFDIENQITQELIAYLGLINEAKSQSESGQDIYFDIQKNYSNSGFVELNRNSTNSLSSISNITNADIFGTSESKGVSYFIKPGSVKRPIRLFEKSWLSLPENELESLHYLLTEENPRVLSENGTVWEKSGKKVAQDLLKTYFGSSSNKYIELNPINKTIRLFDKVIDLSKLTVDDLKKAASNRDFDQVVSENTLSKNKNVKVLNSPSEVTEIGQWYNDGDYVKEAVGIRRSYGGVKSLDTTVKSIKEFRTVNGIKEIVLNAKDIPFRQFVYNTSYVAAKLNGNNELKGGGAYLVFKPSLFSYSEIDDDLKFFSKTIESINSTELDNLKALDWFKNSPLSEVVSLLFSDKNLNQGPKHIASFFKNAITLTSKAPGIVVYHEAFHAYFNGILSSSDREKVFSELRKEKNSFNVTVNGENKTVNFSAASDLELEEYLAEEFRDYATTESSSLAKKSSLIKSIFDKILQAIKSFFGKASYSELVSLGKSNRIIDSMFNTLYQGKFNSNKYNSISTEEKYFSTEIKDVKFSAEELELLDSSMLSLTSLLVGQVLNTQMTTENRTKALSVLNKMISVSETSEEYKKLQDELDSINSGYPRGFGIVELNKPEILKVNLNFIKKALELKLKVFKTDLENNPGNKVYEFKVNLLSKALTEEVLGSSNNIQEYLSEKEPSTLFSRFIKEAEFLNLNKKYLGSDQEVDETEETFILGADQYNNDVNELNALEKETKVLLSSVQEYTNQGTGVVVVNNLGFPKLRTLSYMQYKIGSNISNSVDAIEMNNKLRELSKTDREINQVFSLLGDLEKNGEDFTDFEHKQWNDFYHSFNKFLTPFTTVIATKKNIFETGEFDTEDVLKSSELQISTGQIGQDRQQVVQVWKSKFNYLLESSSAYVETDEFGKKYLNLDYILNDYTLDKDKMFIKTNESSRGPLITPVLNGLNTSDYTSKKNKASWDVFNFLKEFGLEIVDDSRVFNTFIKGDLSNGFQSGLIDYLIEHLQNRLTKGNFISKNDFKISPESNRLYAFDDLFKPFTYQDKYGTVKKSNQFGTLKQLSKLHYMFSNDSGTFMAYNAEGNKQNQMSYPSSLYNMVKVMNKVSSYEELINIPGFENFNLDNNILIGTSPWFKAMFNLFPNTTSWGKRNFDIKINVELLGGSKFIQEDVSGSTSYLRETGITPMSSDEITKFISDVALTFDNKQETPRAEAKSTSVSVSGYIYKESTNEFRGGVNLVFTPKEVSEIMSEGYEGELLTEVFVDHLEAELLRFSEINKAKEIPSLLFDASYLNRGLEFQFFDDILDDKLKNDLINLSVSDLGDLRLILNEEPLLKQSLENQLKNYFTRRSQLLAENKISVSFPQSLLEKVRISTTDDNDILLDRMLQTFLLNNVVNNLNYSSLFLGDFSNYNLEGEDFHKRIAGLLSTGKSFRDDPIWLSYLNKTSYGLTKKLISENQIQKETSKTVYDATLSTAIIKEKKSKSVYSDYYKEYLGIDSSEYESMTEADGQGWLSLDAYRILSLSSNEWSSNQEKLYKKIVLGESLDFTDIQTTFPVRKFQYYGPVQGGSSELKLGLNAFHKYSLAPLVPSLIKNTPLEQLHLKMMEQGIDYVTMESGTKLGKISPVTFEQGKFVNNVDVFYNDDRTINSDISFTKNIIHTKYLKNQLFLAEGYKGKITLPTQIRKIGLLGLFKAGIPTDFKTKSTLKVASNNNTISTDFIYNKLGNKTVSENVVIKSVYQKAGVEYAKSIGGIFSLRIDNNNTNFGNPFSSVQSEIDKGLIPTKSTKESVVKYIDWVLNNFNLEKKNLFTVTPRQVVDKKAIIKASIATQYIGFGEGIAGSSTELYRQQAGKYANTGIYSYTDTIFVSIGGKRGTEQQQKEQQDRTIKEVLKAIDTGATIITDNKTYIDSNSYNTGEKRLYSNLEAKGYKYSEKTIDGNLLGIWNKEGNRAEWIREQLKSGKLKGKPIVYYKELGEPSHATALDYLINKYNWNTDAIVVNEESINRKEVWNSLSESEKRKSSKHYDWFKRYEENLSKMTKFLRTDLESSLGLSLNPSTGLYEGDSKKLIGQLKIMLEDKELLSSEIDSLIDENTGELIEDLSFSLQASTIEKLLVQMVDKKLRRLKINGESLVQVSGSMYESLGVVPVINKDGQLKYGSNQLKFYHAVDKDGNPVEATLDDKSIVGVSKMEVIISLQGDYKNLLELNHTDGKKIKVFEKGKLSYEKSLERLNEMLDSDEFRKQHESLLTMPGVRIPTQGPNSLFIPTVRKFLPEYAGPIVILPIEIVAQSGSDFDIDKMFTMMKNIGNYNGEIEEIKYVPTDKNIDELKTELANLKKELSLKNKSKIKAFSDFVVKKKETDSMKSDVMEVYNMLKEINSLEVNVPISDREFITKLIDTQKEDLLLEMDNIWLSYFGTTEFTKDERNEYIKTELGSLWEIYDSLNYEVTEIKNKVSSIDKIIDQNSIKGLENEFMDLISEKVTMVSNLKSLVTANTVDSAKPLATKVLEKRKDSSDEYNKRKKLNSNSKNVSRTEAMMYEYNLYKHQENSVGKDSLGIAAVTATFHALFTTIDGTIQQNEKDVDQAYLKALDLIKTKSDKTNLAALGEAKSIVSKYLSKKLLVQSNTDSNGNLFFGSNYDSTNKEREISDIISQLVNGYVDVAKDAWIFLIEGNKENTPTLLTMILAGVPIEDAVNLCTHPLVRKYTKLKQTLKGPFANMTQEKSSFTSFEVKETALDTIFKYFVNPVMGPVSFSYINNMNEKPFSSEELEKLSSNSKFGQRDIELFAQYLHVEKIADELTTLTSLTKFDTQKISSVSEAMDRISNTVDYSKRSVNETFFGNKYLNALEKSIVGNFNNDSFISNVFDKQFNTRNNKVLTNLSLQLKKKDLPKGVDLSVARNQFKNDFILFLYQNSVYSGDTKTVIKQDGSIKTYTLEKHDSPVLLIEDEVVYYNDINTLAAEITKPEYSHVKKYFLNSVGPNNFQVKNFIGFVLEYQNLLEEFESATTEELSDKFFMFDKPDNGLLQYGPDAYKRMILQRAAMFYSSNPESMFDSDMGIVPMINQLKSKYPELVNYSLVRDLRWDYDSKRKKYNLFLPSLLNDTNLLKAYKENLKDLSNHPSSEVRSIFNESYFSHLGIMQTGLSRNVKHDIARVGNPRHLQNELLFSKTASKIKTTLDQATANFNKNLKDGVKDNSQYLILSQYFDLYKRMLNQNLYFSRNNGLNYTISDINYVDVFNPVNSELSDKVSLVPIKNASYAASDFDSIENLEEFIKELSDKGSSFVRLPDTKITLLNTSKQFEFDKYLLQYLNVDNSGDVPKIIQKSKYANSSGLDVGPILDSIKSKSLEKTFNAVSANSNKFIGLSVSNPNKNLTSSVSSFLKAVETDNVLSKALNNSSFSKSDSVFVFSDSFNETAYAGYTKEQYTDQIQKTFEGIKKLINPAISKGSILNVLTGTGVNQLIREYLHSAGYLSKTVYVDNVKYYQFEPYENFTSFGEGIAFNVKQNVALYDIVKDLKNNINFLNDLSKIKDPLERVKFADNSFNVYLNNPLRSGFKTGVSYRQSIISELFLTEGYFEIGNSEVDILFEQALNRFRKNLKDKAGKTSFFTLLENYNSKQQTFDTLDIFTEQQKESILKKLSLTYPEVFSNREKTISIINSLLTKDLESTVENLKNCVL